MHSTAVESYLVDKIRYLHDYERNDDSLIKAYGAWDYDSEHLRPLKLVMHEKKKNESAIGSDVPLHLQDDPEGDS